MDEKTRLYRIWHLMLHRCHCCRENSIEYRYYRGRGIAVCDEWKNSFENFKKWSLQNGYCEEYKGRKLSSSIDRIDPDGNYEPANCRWVTRSENCARTRKPTARKTRPKTRIEIQKPGGKTLTPRYISIGTARHIAVKMFEKYGIGTIVRAYDASNNLIDEYKCQRETDIITLKIGYQFTSNTPTGARRK